MKRRLLTSGAAALAFAVALTGCAAQSTDSSSEGGADGLAAVPGFDPDQGTIKVGNILALSGPIAAGAKEQLVGQNAWFDKVNSQGGVAGKYKIELVTADNQYNAQLAVQAYEKIRGDVVMLSGILGTPSVKALVPLMMRNDGNAVPSNQDANIKDEPSLVPIFGSYQTNVVNAVSYLNSSGRAKADSAKYCALVMENDWGDAVVEGMEYITDKLGSKVTEVQRFNPTDTQFTAQMQALKSAQCSVVAFGGAEGNTPSMVAAASQLNFNPTWVSEFIAHNIGFADMPEVAKYLQSNFVFTGPGNDLEDTSVEGIKNLKDSIGDKPVTLQYVYGYMQAVTTTTILEKAIEMGDLSGKGIREAIASTDTLTFQGLNGEVKLGADNRILPRTTTLYQFKPSAENKYGLKAAEVQYNAPEGLPDKF
ncbi:ABC-type branched-subunit amino acid transport system substrate-binding protein [Saccharomonospora amisosensis]|uniref:ABC-type branched-subunit amino acid transport system substrate-binding protein n=1 Tax=Saccharomonospora amisosensis TaxID=1128677 RepID=A0A7X5URF3_9PSEU|nr:ABC transporter substrate-binding protein [Saccharomonospora amisosensis]NIJ12502.1 ABC-type branched-subunit amino acid transport system substrate-binding protein [Saccharomonospora amisosensis]